MVCARGDCTHRSVGGRGSRQRINGRTEAWAQGCWPGLPRWLQHQLSNLSPTGAGAGVMRVRPGASLQSRARPGVSHQMEREITLGDTQQRTSGAQAGDDGVSRDRAASTMWSPEQGRGAQWFRPEFDCEGASENWNPSSASGPVQCPEISCVFHR